MHTSPAACAQHVLTPRVRTVADDDDDWDTDPDYKYQGVEGSGMVRRMSENLSNQGKEGFSYGDDDPNKEKPTKAEGDDEPEMTEAGAPLRVRPFQPPSPLTAERHTGAHAFESYL